jgi:archaemetzincin
MGFSTQKKATIYVQPFKGFPQQETEYLTERLKKVYPYIEVREPIDLPNSCKNDSKTRYRADKLISFLRDNTKEGSFTVGLTNKDISTTKGEYQDWGVMGLGYCPGSSCVISTFRVKGKDRLNKVFKLTIHELGHTQGLPHCLTESCIMSDAKGKDKFNEENGFCKHCKNKLTRAGWKL